MDGGCAVMGHGHEVIAEENPWNEGGFITWVVRTRGRKGMATR